MQSTQFIQTLQRYLSDGILSRSDKMLSFFSPSLPFFLNAKMISRKFSQMQADPHRNEISFNCEVKIYDGKNASVFAMINFLSENLQEELAGAYLHGSLATGEEILYSDFDGLIILKDDVVKDASRLYKTAMKLRESRRIMNAMDPLQHHGWFVLTENALKNYPVTYFPPVLFEYSKSIFKESIQKMQLSFDKSKVDFKTPFYRFTNTFIKKLRNKIRPVNLYELKNLLSEFMLLPALYCQAKYSEGIFKKLSFDKARKDFTDEEWKVMDDVSAIRLNWHFEKKGGGQNNIPGDIELFLTIEFYSSMELLTLQMQNKLRNK